MMARNTIWWDSTATLIAGAREALGDERAFTVLMCRLSHDLRDAVGVDCGKRFLQGFVDTMEAAARHEQ